MLCQPIKTDEELLSIAAVDHGWFAQRKVDGVRLIVCAWPTGVDGFNRNGNKCFVPQNIRGLGMQLATNVGSVMLDGELIGEDYYIFDCISSVSTEINTSCFERCNWFDKHINPLTNFKIVEKSNTTRKSKIDFLRKGSEEKWEGVVFKQVNSIYKPGKRSDSWMKYKFTKTIDCFVLELHKDGTEQSVSLGLLQDGKEIQVAGCKIPLDVVSKLCPGDVVEVNYLYATANLDLAQPTFKRLRLDKSQDECTIDQLIFKGPQ